VQFEAVFVPSQPQCIYSSVLRGDDPGNLPAPKELVVIRVPGFQQLKAKASGAREWVVSYI
jgi:hypothetical protein